jgi:hypothetical protein
MTSEIHTRAVLPLARNMRTVWFQCACVVRALHTLRTVWPAIALMCSCKGEGVERSGARRKDERVPQVCRVRVVPSVGEGREINGRHRQAVCAIGVCVCGQRSAVQCSAYLTVRCCAADGSMTSMVTAQHRS